MDGDVIKVFQGTYKEQVEMRGLSDIALEGDLATIAVPDAGMTGSLVKIVNCKEFRFVGFTIDGTNNALSPGSPVVNYGNASSGGDADTRFYGLFVINSSGEIVNNAVQNISWHYGVQQGIGMYVYVMDGVGRDINIRENTVTNFQKGGVSVRGPVKSKIHKNTITHWGETGIIAGNGLQVDGGTASITSNVIGSSRYYDETHTQWGAAAMLLIASAETGDNFRVVRNSVSNSDYGIYVYDFGAGLTNSKVINNTFRDIIWDGLFGPGDMKDHANKYE